MLTSVLLLWPTSFGVPLYLHLAGSRAHATTTRRPLQPRPSASTLYFSWGVRVGIGAPVGPSVPAGLPCDPPPIAPVPRGVLNVPQEKEVR